MTPIQPALRALFIAPIGSVAVSAAFAIFFQHLNPLSVGFVLALAWVWVLSLATGGLFVLPLLAFVPRIRKPPLWCAAIWGALAGLAFSSLVFGRLFLNSSVLGVTGIAGAGAASGLVYGFVVRRGVNSSAL